MALFILHLMSPRVATRFRPAPAAQEQRQTTVAGPLRQSVLQPEDSSFASDGCHVPIGPSVGAEKYAAEGSKDQGNVTGTVDETRMRSASRPARSLFPMFPACYKYTEELWDKSFNVRPQDRQEDHDRRLRCSVCGGDQNQSSKGCSEIYWMLNSSPCRYCGCGLYRRAREGCAAEWKRRAAEVLPSKEDIPIQDRRRCMHSHVLNGMQSKWTIRSPVYTNMGHEVSQMRWTIVLDTLWKCPIGTSNPRYQILFLRATVTKDCTAGTTLLRYCNDKLATEFWETLSQFCTHRSSHSPTLWKSSTGLSLELCNLDQMQTCSVRFRMCLPEQPGRKLSWKIVESHRNWMSKGSLRA